MSRRPLDHIRNFAIVAHIDHGKSTLADRLLEVSGLVQRGVERTQLLDDLDLERERGITIKARAVRMPYERDGKTYILNLIDTPGHVDFTYEVSRSLAACEGALLLVDATQGVEAQTVANAYLAVEGDLELIPVLNKVDMQGARPDEVAEEIETVLGIDASDAVRCSAKTGIGVPEVLDRILDRIPPPIGDPDAPLKALLFDAVYDTYRGVIVYVRLIDGSLKAGQTVRFHKAGALHEVTEVGVLSPNRLKVDALNAGESGYLVASIKSLGDVKIGDTVTTHPPPPDLVPLPGYKEPRPMVYCGLYPTYPKDFEQLRKALQTLQLNDASFTFVPETSEALGFGFRCGFLGLLHMEIVQERLERDSDIDLVQTADKGDVADHLRHQLIGHVLDHIGAAQEGVQEILLVGAHQLDFVRVEKWSEILLAEPAAQHQLPPRLAHRRRRILLDVPGPEVADAEIMRRAAGGL